MMLDRYQQTKKLLVRKSCTSELSSRNEDSTWYFHGLRSRAARTAFLLSVLLLLSSCSDPNGPSDVSATYDTTPARPLHIAACPEVKITDGFNLYPSLPEGTLPADAVVEELLWCHYNRQTDQLVDRRTANVESVIDQLSDVQLSNAEVDSVCNLAPPDEPALFARTTTGTYRFSLPRNHCENLALAVNQALDANDDRWQISGVS